MDNMDFDYTIEMQKVADEQSVLSVTRLLASKLIKKPYMSVGSFFKDISDTDLQLLLDISDTLGDDVEEEDQHPNSSDILLIAEMLARAEGVHASNINETTSNMKAFVGFLCIESLARKGLVRAFRDRFSFGAEMQSITIAEAIN